MCNEKAVVAVRFELTSLGNLYCITQYRVWQPFPHYAARYHSSAYKPFFRKPLTFLVLSTWSLFLYCYEVKKWHLLFISHNAML